MRILRHGVLLAAALLATGCLQSTTVINLKADGSGTVEQTTIMSAAALAQLKQFAGSFGGKDAGAINPFSEKEEREKVAKMGDGVTFVSSEPVKTEAGEGRRTVYAFTDINKLALNEQPNAPGNMPMDMAGAPGAGRPQDLDFSLTHEAGGNALLHIRFPEPKVGADAKLPPSEGTEGAAPEMPSAQQLAMVKQMLGGLKISIAVKPVGTLVRTNSPFVSDGTVTLFEMDFDQLLDNPAAMAKLQQLKSLEDAKAAFKDVKGLKVNPSRDLEIEFTPGR